jgi:hypothetical protein
MCDVETLRRLIKKYHTNANLTSEELKILVEGLDKYVSEPDDREGSKIAASYMLSRIASRIDELQNSIVHQGKEARRNFTAIIEILENRRKASPEVKN